MLTPAKNPDASPKEKMVNQNAVVIHTRSKDQNASGVLAIQIPVPQAVQNVQSARQALQKRIENYNRSIETFNHVQAAKWSGACLGLSGMFAIAGAAMGALGSPVLLTAVVATGAGGIVLALNSCRPAARAACKADREEALDQELAGIEADKKSLKTLEDEATREADPQASDDLAEVGVLASSPQADSKS